MPFIAFFAALLVVFVLVVATPFLLVLRYRVGIARRPARRWIATVNLLSLLLSTGLFLWIAAMTNFWVPHAFGYSLIGLSVGVLLGLLGLKLTRWEAAGRVVYYTPNRLLVLLITLAVAARMLYGVWRIWHAWHTTGHDSSWLASAGIPGSMAVGALVLGHYVIYFAGIVWRLRSTMPRPFQHLVLLVGALLLTSCSLLQSDFPTEEQMKARLRVGMTDAEVRSALGPPATTSHEESGALHLLYVSSIGTRTVEKLGYVGFDVRFVDGKVQSWRIIKGDPSYGAVTEPRELKWAGYYWIALLLGGILYGLFKAFRRGLSEEQIILKAYEKRNIPRLPTEFRFINNDTTLQEVIDRVGRPTRERKLPIDPNRVTGGYAYTDGPMGLPAIVLVEYDLPYHAVVALLPEYPFLPENRIRAAFYRGSTPDEEF